MVTEATARNHSPLPLGTDIPSLPVALPPGYRFVRGPT